jgi:hypothetical protein
MDARTAARNALGYVLEARKGEKMIVICDEEKRPVGEAFAGAALDMGLYTRLVMLPDEKAARKEIPPGLEAAVIEGRLDEAGGLVRELARFGREDPGAILARVDRGFYMDDQGSYGFNPVTGDFSRGAAGLWIEGGRPVHAVEEVTIAGNLGAMLEAVDAVGNDLLWLGSVAAPTLRVARMTVAGD